MSENKQEGFVLNPEAQVSLSIEDVRTLFALKGVLEKYVEPFNMVVQLFNKIQFEQQQNGNLVPYTTEDIVTTPEGRKLRDDFFTKPEEKSVTVVSQN